MHTHWDCGSLGAVSQWCWAASEHILSPAQDSIWWLARCNWSVDYYLSCACQIKIIKMQGGRDGEWNVSGLLRCGRVVHAFPLLETDRKPHHTSQEDVMPLRKLNLLPPPSLLNCTVDECMTGRDTFPPYKLTQKPECWEMGKCWRTWVSLWADWQLWQRRDVRSGLYRSRAVQGRQKSVATSRRAMTDSADGHLYRSGARGQKQTAEMLRG